MDYRYLVPPLKRWFPTLLIGFLAVLTGIQWWRNGEFIYSFYYLFLFIIPFGVALFAAVQPLIPFQGKVLRKQLDTHATRHGRFFDYRIFLEDGTEMYVPKEVYIILDEQDEVRGLRQQRELLSIEAKIDASRDIAQRKGELEAEQSAMAWRSRKRTLLVIAFFLLLLVFGYYSNFLE
jgi:hypothetical protein